MRTTPGPREPEPAPNHKPPDQTRPEAFQKRSLATCESPPGVQLPTVPAAAGGVGMEKPRVWSQCFPGPASTAYWPPELGDIVSEPHLPHPDRSQPPRHHGQGGH